MKRWGKRYPSLLNKVCFLRVLQILSPLPRKFDLEKIVSLLDKRSADDLHPFVWIFGLAILNGSKLVEELLS
jgi:hypothetical protein